MIPFRESIAVSLRLLQGIVNMSVPASPVFKYRFSHFPISFK